MVSHGLQYSHLRRYRRSQRRRWPGVSKNASLKPMEFVRTVQCQGVDVVLFSLWKMGSGLVAR